MTKEDGALSSRDPQCRVGVRKHTHSKKTLIRLLTYTGKGPTLAQRALEGSLGEGISRFKTKRWMCFVRDPAPRPHLTLSP